MKKSGFTLAEVLLTMGIIGIVAAMTAPSLIMGIKDEVSMSRLSTAVSSVENAFTTAISREDVQDLYNTDMWSASTAQAFAGKLGKYLATNGCESTTYGSSTSSYYAAGPFFMNSDGGAGAKADVPTFFSGAYPINLKSGAVVFIHPLSVGTSSGTGAGAFKNEDSSKEDTHALWSIAAAVLIDTNGSQNPNVWGKDIFGFYAGHNGILYPLGSADVKAFNSALDKTCQAASTGTNADKGGLGCADTVVKAGYKVNY